MLTKARLDDPIVRHLRTDHVELPCDLTVGGALADIRRRGPGDNPVYFYVVDADRRLVGVLPIRALLTQPLDRPLGEIMRPRVVSLPASFTVLDACEFFVLHRYLALPVVDRDQHLLGVVDVALLTDEMFNLHERQAMDAFFETLGVRLSQVRDASPWKAFRARFPWLLATIASGLLCALVAGRFELTLAKSLVLAFFLTLLLGLGESVSVQTMTLMVYRMRAEQPGWRWYWRALRREMGAVLLLAAASALVVSAFVLAWKREPAAAAVVGGGILASLAGAGAVGVTVPSLLHVLRLDLKIAAGPVTLAVVDVWTIVAYLSLATWVLGR